MTHRPYTPPAWQAKPLADGRVTLLVVPLKVQPKYEYRSWETNLPYAPGDLIWCRETWGHCIGCNLYYRRRESAHPECCDECSSAILWRPPVTMPKWAARTWLRCTGVEVRRVQTISDDEAWAVGCPKGDPTDNGGWFPKEELQPDGSEMGWDCPEDWVADKWDEQYAPKPRKRAGGTLPPKSAVDLSFDANPWAAFVAVEKISKEDV